MEGLLTEAIRTLPAWLLGFLAIVWLINRLFDYLKSRNKSTVQMSENQLLNSCVIGISGVKDDLNAHDDKMATCMSGIETQLVKMNSGLGKAMSTHDQKKMIEYQVSWCRDMTFRIIQASIEKNNIGGREDIVITKIMRAFKTAAKEARESLESLEGMTYEYSTIFDTHLPRIWRAVLQAATPLYYRDLPEGATLEEGLEDLDILIKSWFDDALERAFRESEDPETGSLFKASAADETGEFENWAALASDLKSYKKGTQTPPLPNRRSK